MCYVACHSVATLLLEKWEDDIHIPEMGTWESTGTLETSKFVSKDQTPRIEAFFRSLESYQSLDVKNGLAWAIWTSASQVMTRRKAGSQTGSLTPDH
jgi:hypothetical protein